MPEVKVTLDFACCACEHSVYVTLKCAGKGLTAASRTVAAVKVPCPTCGMINQLLFEPNGTVRAVNPVPSPRSMLEPSLN